MRCRCGLRNAAALVTKLLALLRNRNVNLPVVGRVHIVTGQEYLRVKDVRVIVQVATLDTRCALRKGLGRLRKREQTERCHLVNLVNGVIRCIEHLRFICACPCLCRRRIAELCAARSVLHQLPVLVICLDGDIVRIAAVSVTVCVKLGIEPSAGQRLYIDRIRGVTGLQPEVKLIGSSHPEQSVAIAQISAEHGELGIRRLIHRDD